MAKQQFANLVRFKGTYADYVEAQAAGKLIFAQISDYETAEDKAQYHIYANDTDFAIATKAEFDALAARVAQNEADIAAIMADYVKEVKVATGELLIGATEANQVVTIAATDKLKDAVEAAEDAVQSVTVANDPTTAQYITLAATAKSSDKGIVITADSKGLETKIAALDAKDTELAAAIAAEETRAKGVEGDLEDLNTTAKDNLVAAINEANTTAKASKAIVEGGNGIGVYSDTDMETGAVTYTVSAVAKTGDKYIEVGASGIQSKGIDEAIEAAIGELDVTDTAVTGKVVKAVSEQDGIITISRDYLAATDIQLVKKETAGEGLASEYYLANGEGTQLGATIQIAKDQFLKEVHFYKSEEDVPTGVTIPTGTEFPVIRFVFTTAAGDTETWVSVKYLVDTYAAGDGLQLVGSTFSVKIDAASEAFLTVGASGVKLDGVRAAIDVAKAEAEAYTDGKIAELDATVGSTSVASGKHVAVQVVEEDGVLTGLTVTESDIASAQALADEIARAQAAEAEALHQVVGGTDGDFVTTTIGTKANHEQTVSVAVTTHTISGATAGNDGLAIASDVRTELEADELVNSTSFNAIKEHVGLDSSFVPQWDGKFGATTTVVEAIKGLKDSSDGKVADVVLGTNLDAIASATMGTDKKVTIELDKAVAGATGSTADNDTLASKGYVDEQITAAVHEATAVQGDTASFSVVEKSTVGKKDTYTVKNTIADATGSTFVATGLATDAYVQEAISWEVIGE